MLLFGLITASLLWVFYLYLSSVGFNGQYFLIGSIMYTIGFSISSYIPLSDIEDEKNKQNSKLSHIIRETLHELNLPTATIKANLNMLYKNSKDEKTSKRLNRIDKATDRLHRLYLELSYAIKSEITPVENETFDLALMLEERVSSAREIFKYDIRLKTEQCVVTLDRVGLEQAIDNILSNAIKYSDPKDHIEVKMLDKTISIEDFGKGMDETALLRIYERYYQADTNANGEGIGLSIVKRYCDKFDLDINIKSKPNHGTKVSISIPWA